MDKLINQFEFGLFFWQVLIFVGLILLLKKFAWKPILDAVNDREEGIKDALLAAENAKKDMQNLKADNEKLLAEAFSYVPDTHVLVIDDNSLDKTILVNPKSL